MQRWQLPKVVMTAASVMDEVRQLMNLGVLEAKPPISRSHYLADSNSRVIASNHRVPPQPQDKRSGVSIKMSNSQ